MENEDRKHKETVISFFNDDVPWYTDVYREDLGNSFLHFDMRRRLKFVTDLLIAQIQKMDNPSVLDCGCGPGVTLALLAPQHCKMTGIDINQRYLDLAAEKIPGAKLIESDIERLPFPDASFDVVFCVGVLMYLKDDQKALKEIARVTKDGGFVLISVPNYLMLHLLLDPYYIFRFLKKILVKDKQPLNNGFNMSKIRRYSLTKFRKLLREYDLHEIRSKVTSYGPMKFWRRELLPLSTSIRISEIMRKWSELKLCAGLKHVGNQFIITLRKGPIPA